MSTTRKHSPKTRRLYVIELRDSVGPRDHERFCNVYVGETGEAISKRYKVHRQGGLYACRVVTEHHLRLRRDLFAGLPATRDKATSRNAEQALAKRLRDAGYRVRTDGGWLSQADVVAPFGMADLTKAQRGRLETAIEAVLANDRRSLTPRLCAHVLWGSTGPAIEAWGMRLLPEFGRYPHVSHTDLVEAVASLVRR